MSGETTDDSKLRGFIHSLSTAEPVLSRLSARTATVLRIDILIFIHERRADDIMHPPPLVLRGAELSTPRETAEPAVSVCV